MVKVFCDGTYTTSPVDAADVARHGGISFVVKSEADLQRLFNIEPLARNQENRLRSIIGL